jgi:hypothetical protein
MAKVMTEDANNLFTTSVKEINQPTILISIPGLIQEANRTTPVKKASVIETNEAKSNAEQAAEFKLNLQKKNFLKVLKNLLA